MFFQTGLLLALGFAFAAFEWQVAPRSSNTVVVNDPIPDVTDIIVHRTFPEPPPPPPAPPQPNLDLEIVDNIIDVGDGLIEFNWENNGTNLLPTDMFEKVTIPEDIDDEIFIKVENPPQFNGKDAETGFREYIRDNLNYPQIALENGISGKVLVQFVVDQKGNVIDVQVVRGVDASLDNEALRLIKSSSGLWVPGKQREKAVKVKFTFPITFKLQ